MTKRLIQYAAGLQYLRAIAWANCQCLRLIAAPYLLSTVACPAVELCDAVSVDLADFQEGGKLPEMQLAIMQARNIPAKICRDIPVKIFRLGAPDAVTATASDYTCSTT